MRALLISASMLTLIAGCATPPQGRPSLDLPVVLSAEGWAALDAADPLGAAHLDRVNAQWLCGYAGEQPKGVCQ